jgi:hypothetical protein
MRQNDARSARMFLEKLGHVVHLCVCVCLRVCRQCVACANVH